MILRGRIVQIPAHRDWSKQLDPVVGRISSMRVMRHIVSTAFSSIIFRPFMFYVIAWMFMHFFKVYFALDPAR